MAAQLNFPAHVGEPELVRPETTTREFQYLSNIDVQSGLRSHIPVALFYPPNKALPGQDPVVMIKQALAKVLIHYFPLAGRIRNTTNERGKLVVECSGEGVVFREAYADITMAQLQMLEGGLKPPFPMWDRFLVDDIWGSGLITDSPLVHMQVTRLACGGFVLAYAISHCITDANGAYMFVAALSEFCLNPNRKTPSTPPAWGREILKPRTPPIVSYPHQEYNPPHLPTITFTATDFKLLAQTSIFFSNSHISALQNQLNPHKASRIHAVGSCLWRAWARALMKPGDTTRLLFAVDTRFQCKPSLPKGFYGNAMLFSCAIAKTDDVIRKPLHYAADLISEAKERVMRDEYRASVLDFIEVNGDGVLCMEGANVIADLSRLRFCDVDFGYGPPVYGGVARAGTGPAPGLLTPVVGHKNEEGVEGLLVLASMPLQAVDRFHKEVMKQIHYAIRIKPSSSL